MMMTTFGGSWLALWSKQAEYEWVFEDVKLGLCGQFMHELRELMFPRSSQITKLPHCRFQVHCIYQKAGRVRRGC